MKRTKAVKSQEDLKSDIFRLKKKLALVLDENQSLKVRIRRLENESRRKDKCIECHKTDSRKVRVARKFVDDDGASVIYKLQRRNEELENLLVERDLENAKRCNDIKTICLYSHLDGKLCPRGSKTSVPSITRLNSGPKINLSSQSSLKKIISSTAFNSKKSNHVRSSNRLGNRPISRQRVGPDEASRVIKILQSERLVDKRTIRTKNAEISRLSAELSEIRGVLKKEPTKITKSTSTTQLQQRKSCIQDARHVQPNFIEHNRNLWIKRPERISRGKSVEITETERKTDLTKLPTVFELNEEIISPIEAKNSKIADKQKFARGLTPKARLKTRIEYVYDSEVSSDGVELCLPNTLRKFLQRAVNFKSNGGEGETSTD